MGNRINVNGRIGGHELYVNGFIVVACAERNPLLGRLAGQVVFREIRTVDRPGFLVTYQSYGPAVAFLAQHVHTSSAGCAGSNNHHRVGVLRASDFKINIPFSINSDPAALALDTEASNRVECGSSFGLSSA
jgi:hypothetical protein